MTSPNYAENNRIANMETKISNMISRLKMASERVQGPFAYALDFPSTVVRAHATNFGALATFQRTTWDPTMPKEVTLKERPGLKHPVFACALYGRGG